MKRRKVQATGCLGDEGGEGERGSEEVLWKKLGYSIPLIQVMLAAGTKTNRDPFLAQMEQLQFRTVVCGSSRGGEMGTVKVFAVQWQDPE